MNKYVMALVVGVSLSVLWSSTSSAEVSVYQSSRSNTADTYNNYVGGGSNSNTSSSNSQNSQNSNNSSQSGSNSASEQDFYDAQNQNAQNIEDYKARAAMTLEEMKRRGEDLYLNPLAEEKPPVKKVRRELMQKRQAVNGIQGTWLPKKVWENDIDNNLGQTLLKKSKVVPTSKKTLIEPIPMARQPRNVGEARRIPRNTANNPVPISNNN